MTFNKDTLFKALEIMWKGMLAILIVILVVMLVTYLMQFISGKWAARKEKPIETTLELAEIVKSSIPAAARREGGHPARRTFQALRIYVNGELDGLDRAIGDMFDSLKVGGRLAIITFHSLEDRAVKQTFASLCEGCICPPEFPVCVCGRKSRGRLPQKAAAPSKAELEENPRSRSARLRVIEKIR